MQRRALLERARHPSHGLLTYDWAVRQRSLLARDSNVSNAIPRHATSAACPRVAFITTEGFRDVLEIGRQNRSAIYGTAPRLGGLPAYASFRLGPFYQAAAHGRRPTARNSGEKSAALFTTGAIFHMSLERARVTIVTTQRESFTHTRRSLDSLYASTSAPFWRVYVDAGSPWWVSSYLRRESKRKGFELLRRDHFLSPNKSRNLGFAHVDTEFVAFIDNDVLFTPGWLNKLVACADEEDAAVVGPLILLGEPPLQKVHSAGGLGTIEETPLGRRYHQKQRYSETPISEVSLDAMRRGPVDTLEFH
jgi:hypothetical protein